MTGSATFSDAVIAWQQRFGRHHLPWQCRDPYRIWVSEIMLQQTQVDTVIRFFERFMAAFPTVFQLAEADFDQVAAYWSGLGYYARARNLHKTAKVLVEQYQGIFPTEPGVLETFPGIGRSTAAAIAAFAFGRRAAILDGNVKRVFSRVFAVDTPIEAAQTTDKLWQKAVELLPDTDIEAYTQGLMDLGASLCSRTRPKCLMCPVAFMCEACASGEATRYPVRKARAAKPHRETAFLILKTKDHRMYLERRPEKGIWGKLWCFPEADASAYDDDRQITTVCRSRFGLTVDRWIRLPAISHVFTHFHLKIWPIIAYVDSDEDEACLSGEGIWAKRSDQKSLGLPKPVMTLWEMASAE